jgi:serpin B
MARRALLLLLPVLLPACAAGPGPVIAEPAGVTVLGAGIARTDAEVAPGQVRALARAQLELAVDVYGALAAGTDDDVVLGPTSLHTALLMVRAGAAGATADELDDGLHLAGTPDPHAAASALDRELLARGEVDGVTLTSANRVWADRTFTPRETYVEQLAGSYGAALASLDLRGDPEGSREAINAWVAANTRDRIPELFPTGTPTRESRLVLANAVALDADWKTPFDAARTRAGDFHLLDGTVVQVPTMQGGDGVEVGRGEGWTAVRLPYAGDDLAMTIVVPSAFDAFEQQLSADLLDEVDAGLSPAGPSLSLPRFTARSASGLKPVLAGLGMTSMFDERRADLSGISQTEQLVVGAVQHEAVVTVDETGTEAAAATGVDIRAVSAPMPVMVDRPFLFVVRDRSTGAVLFLGRVTDPR